MQVIFPMLANSMLRADGFQFPKPLIEIGGKTILEQTISYYSAVRDVEFIFVIRSEDNAIYALSSVMEQAAPSHNVRTIISKGETSGALSTVLLASKYISKADELIIANYDQKIEFPIDKILDSMRCDAAEFGVATFESVHPNWSYVKTNGNKIIEAAEKRVISRQAIAGIYYYQSGELFINSAKSAMIDAPINQSRNYTSDTLNQLILDGRRGIICPISRSQYINYYDASIIRAAQRHSEFY